jgi:hypothetical protein
MSSPGAAPKVDCPAAPKVGRAAPNVLVGWAAAPNPPIHKSHSDTH